jgi:hypothetical protein
MSRLSATGAFDYYPPVPTGTECSASLQDAIARTQTIGGRLVIGPGVYRVATSIVIPSGMTVIGPGAVITATGDFPAVNIVDTDGTRATDVVIEGLGVAHTNTLNAPAVVQAASYGFKLWGDRITLRGCRVDDCYVGVYTDEVNGALVASTEIVLDDVRVDHQAPTVNGCLWGFQLDFVTGLTARNCRAYNQWLDGFKLHQQTFNVEIAGGEFADNGVSGAGDGIDAFAGGDYFKIIGSVCVSNHGQGINIKSGDLNIAGAWGYLRRWEVAHVTCNNTAFAGLQVNRSTATNPTTEPLATQGTITGGQFNDNGSVESGVAGGSGVQVRGRNIAVTGITALRNVGAGFSDTPESMDLTLTGGVFAANCVGAGGGYNVYVTGLRTRVQNCIAIGKDSPDITANADYAALPVVTDYGYVLALTANTCILDRVTGHSHGLGLVGVQGAFAANTVQLHLDGAGDPNGVYPGSPGSTFSRSDGGALTSFYVKEVGPVENLNNWVGK